MPERIPIRTTGSIRDEILDELCAGKQRVLLATPYFAVEARLVERREGQLALRVPMSGEAIKKAVGNHQLRLRFSWDLSMFAGPTSILGTEQQEQLKLVLIEPPEHLVLDERRATWRTDQTGKSRGAIRAEGTRIIRVSLENLSTRGAGVFCLDALPQGEFYSGRQVSLEMNLDKGPTFQVQARICHGEGQSLGLGFHSDPQLEDLLAKWIAPKRKEAQRAWDNRLATRAAAEASLKPKPDPKGLLLVTSDPSLSHQIASLFEPDLAVRISTPVLSLLKKAMEEPPEILLLDISGASLDTRHRLRTMMEALNLVCPVLVIGQSVTPEVLRSFTADLKAAWGQEWNPGQGPWFQRLVKGLIQRHKKALES